MFFLNFFDHKRTRNIQLLDFSKDQKLLDNHSTNLQELKENYIKSQDLPKWKRKVFIRKTLLKVLIPSYFLAFIYRKGERLLDFLEYGI